MSSALPSGFYDLLVTERTRMELQARSAGTGQTHALSALDGVRLAETLHRQLASVLQDLSHSGAIAAQLDLVNGLMPKDAAESMLSVALVDGADDNVSVVVVKIRE